MANSALAMNRGKKGACKNVLRNMFSAFVPVAFSLPFLNLLLDLRPISTTAALRFASLR